MVCDYLLKRHQKVVLGLAFLVVVLLLLTPQHLDVLHLKSAIVDRASDLYSIPYQHDGGAVASSAYVVDYMTEEDALKLRACKDPKLAADTNHSKVSIIHGSTKGVYRLGDKIPVTIHLYDGYGKPLSSGGAVLTARMFNTSQEAFAKAPVTDHGNGTYTAVFEALWTGKADITVHIAHTPEMIRAQYYMRKKLNCLRCVDGIFSVLDKNISETTSCYPFVDVLKNGSNVAICNLTGDNSGMPWYCIRPRNIHLLCEDWAGMISRNPDLPLTSCEGVLLDRVRQDIPPTLTIHVEKAPGSQSNIVHLPSNPCSEFNKAALWTLKQPTGFMHGGQWLLRHCKGIEDTRMLPCLRNKKVLLFGDSTSRYWYSHILDKWRCNSTSEAWNTGIYHKRASCANTAYNFTVQWLPHSQPNYNERKTRRYTTTSITRHLDETGNDEHVVALIHIYVHLLPYHHRVFRLKMHKIRLNVVDLLKRNKNALVLIKGPHTIHENCIWTRRRSDFYVPVYKHILYEEFMGLHERVVFLDHKDVSDALVPRKVHPPGPAVAAMVKQMLDYIC